MDPEHWLNEMLDPNLSRQNLRMGMGNGQLAQSQCMYACTCQCYPMGTGILGCGYMKKWKIGRFITRRIWIRRLLKPFFLNQWKDGTGAVVYISWDLIRNPEPSKNRVSKHKAPGCILVGRQVDQPSLLLHLPPFGLDQGPPSRQPLFTWTLWTGFARALLLF